MLFAQRRARHKNVRLLIGFREKRCRGRRLMTMGTKWYVRRCAVGTLSAMGVYLLTLALCAYLTARGIVAEGQMARCVWL